MWLLESYKKLVENNIIKFDEKQVELIKELEIKGKIISNYLDSHFIKKVFLKKPKGLYIYGDVGRGKSMIMNLFYDNFPHNSKTRIHFHDFIKETHELLKKYRQEGNYSDITDKVAEYYLTRFKLLCFDELYFTDVANVMLIGRIIEKMLEKGLILIATSNREINNLDTDGVKKEHFTKLIHNLNQNMDEFEIKVAQDYRLTKKLDSKKLGFIKLENHYELIEKTISELANVNLDKLTKKTINFQKREIIIEKTYLDIAILDFLQFFNSNLSVADFNKISENFNYFIVYNITKTEGSETSRRFSLFIDIIYEAKKKVIFMVDENLSNLLELSNIPEFPRTMSRIHEIASEEYWSNTIIKHN